MNGSTRFAVAADHIFDGRTKHENAAVVIEGSQIISLIPQSELKMDLSIQRLPVGFWLAPGFIDLQVNGGGDVLDGNGEIGSEFAADMVNGTEACGQFFQGRREAVGFQSNWNETAGEVLGINDGLANICGDVPGLSGLSL